MIRYYSIITGIILSLALSGCKSGTLDGGKPDPRDSMMVANKAYFDSIAINDVKLKTPQAGEWLHEHKETGQTFDQFKAINPFIPTKEKNIIYLLPYGSFTNIQLKALGLTREYIELFFQRRTVLMDPLKDSDVPAHAKRSQFTGTSEHTQLLSSYVLDSVLKHRMPKDGIALMALSEKDLYPKADWNFVFGQASYGDRVGVSSIYRLQDEQLDSTNFLQCLKRLLNVSSHEIGHMLSIRHCTFAKCSMNGSNSMRETDLSPNRLCSQCQQKMFWSFKYDNKKRLQDLYEFVRRNRLGIDLHLLKLDLDKVGLKPL